MLLFTFFRQASDIGKMHLHTIISLGTVTVEAESGPSDVVNHKRDLWKVTRMFLLSMCNKLCETNFGLAVTQAEKLSGEFLACLQVLCTVWEQLKSGQTENSREQSSAWTEGQQIWSLVLQLQFEEKSVDSFLKWTSHHGQSVATVWTQ
jgi:hypothetical protein